MNIYKCECGKEFNSYYALNGHYGHCDIHCNLLNKKRNDYHKGTNRWDHISSEKQKIYHQKQGKTLSYNLQNGITKHPFKDKHHSEETKQKLREKYIERMIKNGRIATFNINACEYFDKLNKENNWNLQHAKNGGEIICCGYWIDAYDKINNIVVEFDERKHYIDPINNILKEKDIERQNIIINKLGCTFYRYNSITNQLYQVYINNKNIFNEFNILISNNLIDFTSINSIKKSLKENSKYSYKSFINFCKTIPELNNKIKYYKERQILNKINQKQNKINSYKNILQNACKESNIDFTKFGWTSKLIQYLKNRNELIDININRALNKYYPEFINIYHPFIRNKK